MLHTLKPAPGSTKRRKRLGRGNSSGHGTYSTKGLKGQKARTGGRKGLAKFAVKGMVMRIPKRRGFGSPHPKMASVSLARILKVFSGAEVVTPRQLVERDVVGSIRYGVKVVGSASVGKPLVVKAHAFSRSAKAALEAGGGKAERVSLGNT